MDEDFDRRLLSSLSAAETRSGESIAAELGCSRAAVWKHVETLRGLGIGVEAVAGQGYRLSEPVELLDREALASGLAGDTGRALSSLRIMSTVDSTNEELLRMPPEARHAAAVLAESQTAGRGRRGRHWFSPYARNLYLSLGWRFDRGVGELGCLPLVVALAACDALERAGLAGLVIKWPNDLLLGGKKLGGCLVEVSGDASGPCTAVMGIGINVHMPRATPGSEAIGQAWTDVGSHVTGVSRNAVAASVLEAMLNSMKRYEETGFRPFLERWEARDGLAGRDIVLVTGTGRVCGISRGISERGGLLIENEAGTREHLAGEVSVGAPR